MKIHANNLNLIFIESLSSETMTLSSWNESNVDDKNDNDAVWEWMLIMNSAKCNSFAEDFSTFFSTYQVWNLSAYFSDRELWFSDEVL